MKSIFTSADAIVSHAINAEENDAEYYHKIATKIISKEIKDHEMIKSTLLQIEMMERNHKIRLKYYQKGIVSLSGLTEYELPLIDESYNFNLNNYLEKILYDAYQNEVKSEENYLLLADMAEARQAREMFRLLANEEKLHQKYIIEKILPGIKPTTA